MRELPEVSVGEARPSTVQEPGQGQRTSPVDAEGLGHAVVQEPMEDIERHLRLPGQTQAVGHDHAVDALLQDLQQRTPLGRQRSQGLLRVEDQELLDAFGRGLEERQAPQVDQVAADEAVAEAVEDAGEEELHDPVLGLFLRAGTFDLGPKDKRAVGSSFSSLMLKPEG